MDTDRSLQKRADAIDLIVLPDGIAGTNCGNCASMNNGFCEHPEVKMDVGERWCCIYWHRPDSPRAVPSSLMTRFRRVMGAARLRRRS